MTHYALGTTASLQLNTKAKQNNNSKTEIPTP